MKANKAMLEQACDSMYSVTSHLCYKQQAHGCHPTVRVKLLIIKHISVSFRDLKPLEHKERC